VEDGRLNLINARALAEARGMELASAEMQQPGAEASIELTVGGAMRSVTVAGLAAAGTQPRLTRIGGFHVDVMPRQTLLILTNRDVPGVIGRVGTLLGDAGVNIAEYHQARLAQGGDALAAVSVDGVLGPDVCAALLELPDVRSATVVRFRDGERV